RRRQTRCYRDWSSDVCSSDLRRRELPPPRRIVAMPHAYAEDTQETTESQYAAGWNACQNVRQWHGTDQTRCLLSSCYRGVSGLKIGRASCRESMAECDTGQIS